MINKTNPMIPLAQQAEYKTALGRVIEISRALSKTTARLEQCQGEYMAVQSQVNAPVDVIERALSLAASPPASTSARLPLVAEIERLHQEQTDLRQGLQAANSAADAVASSLSQQAGRLAKPSHVAAVKLVLECVKALCAANAAEEDVRRELSSLGYERHGLPCMRLTAIGDINDSSGTPAYYFAKEAKYYL